MRRRPFIGFDIAGKLFANARAQHLDRNLAPISRARAVHLRDRSRADRFRVDMFEQLCRRFVEAVVNLFVNPLKLFGRQ